MRIDSLSYSNAKTQGATRRAWLQQHSPQHLEQCNALLADSLNYRQAGTSPSILILGAGACTEVPLALLARVSDEVILIDLDRLAMQQAQREITSPTLQKRIQPIQADVSGGISANLKRLLDKQPWDRLVKQGASAVFDAMATCLERCSIPDPPAMPGIAQGAYGLVISSLLLSQLFSYPLLDILDTIQRIAPQYVGEQERHRRYQDAAQSFRIQTIQAHLHLLRALMDSGGVVALLSDIRGFVFEVYGTEHDAAHRRVLPLVPRTLPEMVRQEFTVLAENQWEWITDLPTNEKLGRGYEVSGYILR
ncbi:MAG: hypothetical protein M3Z24_04065 [Chloroflexota bacterium]|nr:hypothetical protein [Chloroflexota bacterium]